METLAKVQKVKTNAESDKESVQAIVKKLLVRVNKEGLAGRAHSFTLFRITESFILLCVVNVLTPQFLLESG